MKKIKVNIENLDNRIDFIDEDNSLLYWSIYDFSYKRRMRIFDNNDINVGYVKLKIDTLNNDIEFCDKQDNLLETFNLDYLSGNIDELKLDIIKNNVSFMHIDKINNECIIEVFDDDILKAIMYMIVVLDLHKKG